MAGIMAQALAQKLFGLSYSAKSRPQPISGHHISLWPLGIERCRQPEPRQHFAFTARLRFGWLVRTGSFVIMAATFIRFPQVAMPRWIEMAAERVDPIARLDEVLGFAFFVTNVG